MNRISVPVYGSDFEQPVITATDEDRAAFNALLDQYRDAPSGIAPFVAGLRSEVRLAGTVQQIQWTFQSDVNNLGMTTQRTPEVRLDKNDAFLATGISVQFGMAADTNEIQGETVLQQWPNPATQATGGFQGAAPAVQQCFNGRLDIEMNNTKFAMSIDMLSMLYAGPAQRGQLFATGGIETAYNSTEGNRGWRKLLPSLFINGSNQTKFTLTMPDASNFGAQTGFVVIAACMLRGWRIGNGGAYRPTDATSGR